MDKHTPEQRKANMMAVKSRGSKIELRLGKALWASGVRYRKSSTKIIGKPDFSITKYKIAIFADSEFWHGKDWEKKKHEIHSNVDFWQHKIERNIIRDKKVNSMLVEKGWTVLRFWGRDIEKHLDKCLEQIMQTIYDIRKKEGTL